MRAWKPTALRSPASRLLAMASPQAAPYLVDGLSGATITSNGVTNTIQFWFGPNGFGPYLKNFVKSQGRS